MSSFHLRELLIYFINLNKSAAETHRNLVETYDEAALSEKICCEWFQKFKNSEFDVEDKERSGRPKVYEDAELEASLDQDSCQTQEEQPLSVTRVILYVSSLCIFIANFLYNFQFFIRKFS